MVSGPEAGICEGRLRTEASGERVLLLYLPTGAGHLAPAKAVAERLSLMGAQTEIFDPAGSRSAFAKLLLQNGYAFLSTRLTLLWRAMYALNKDRASMDTTLSLVEALIGDEIVKAIDRFKPTRILNFHAFLDRALRRALLKRPSIPCAVVVTDPYEPPPIWNYGHRFPLICYTQNAADTLASNGAAPSRIFSEGCIVASRFEGPVARERLEGLRSKLGLDGRPIVLVAGGGPGLPRMGLLARALLGGPPDYQTVIVCGWSERDRSIAEREAARRPDREAVVLGFTDAMRELMELADVVVTKAGASTTAELLAVGKPIVVWTHIRGQEDGIVRHLMAEGVLAHLPEPSGLVDFVERALKGDGVYAEMKARAASRPKPRGAEAVARRVVSL
jgi:UDP-N-acetylglucosamine:LPS N-acetylglucosamine transferase